MNSLSWMIYLAGLSGSVSVFLSFLAIMSGILAVASTVIWFGTMGPPRVYSWEDRDEKIARYDGIRTQLRKLMPRAAVAFAAFGLTSTVLPSKETIYAIAASEMGEELINTPTAGKAVKALDAWLDRQIASNAPGKPESK